MQTNKRRKPAFLKGFRHVCRVCTPAEIMPANDDKKVLFDLCSTCYNASSEERERQSSMFSFIYSQIEEEGGLVGVQTMGQIMNWYEDGEFTSAELADCANLMFAKGFIQLYKAGGIQYVHVSEKGSIHRKMFTDKPVVDKSQLALVI